MVRGYTAATDAKLRAELLVRPRGAGDGGVGEVKIASVDSTPPPPGGGFHLQAWIDAIVCAPAVQAEAGEGLVLRIEYLSGAKDFSVVETQFTVP